MTISELIERLEAIKAEHGDLEINRYLSDPKITLVRGVNLPDYIEVIA